MTSPRQKIFHLGLLLLTFGSVTLTHRLSGSWPESLAFAAALLAILGAHEMGHYVLARRHGVDSSLPYFIPVPLLGFGTLGAVIRLKSRIPDRNALVEIGAAGPLAGLAVALPILVMGLLQSHWVALPAGVEPGAVHQSLLDVVRHRGSGLFSGGSSGAGGLVVLYNDNLLMKGLERLLCGPAPAGEELMAHPFVLAGWFGMLVTLLNLIPLGQLDGGHLTYALLGDRARALGVVMAAAVLVLVLFFSVTWVPWLFVTTVFVGFRHPRVLDEAEPAPLGRRQKLICALCALAFVLCFLPIPVSVLPVP